MFENLKTLRQLIANEKKMPAYTVFSDAALIDMVRKRPHDRETFLDVSGVGEAKQKQYSEVFLSVIRDGHEPNDAMDEFRQTLRETSGIKASAGSTWFPAEEEQLREEVESDLPLEEIAKKHRRSVGSIVARMRKLLLIE